MSQFPTTHSTSAASLPKGLNITLWVLQILQGLAFLAAGGMILKGGADVDAGFNKLGFGHWFQYVIGALEMIGGLLLLTPALCGVGAVIIACIMIGAVVCHLTRLGGSPLGAIVMLVIAAAIAWFRRDRTMRLVRR